MYNTMSILTDSAWLPTQMPSHVQLVVSAQSQQVINALSSRGWEQFCVEPLGKEDVISLSKK